MDYDISSDALSVKISELLVATADGADELVDKAVPQVLKLLRLCTHMDVVFVSEFADGQRVFRYVDSEGDVVKPGWTDPIEKSWCQRVVDGRLPEYIPDTAKLPPDADIPSTVVPRGTHLSAPIVLSDGRVYGTLCAFSFGINREVTERDMRRLKFTAELTARKLERELVAVSPA
jgi:GAF domain-containing protein